MLQTIYPPASTLANRLVGLEDEVCIDLPQSHAISTRVYSEHSKPASPLYHRSLGRLIIPLLPLQKAGKQNSSV